MKNFIVLVCLAGALFSCKQEEVDALTTTTMRINYYRQNCEGVGPQTCYLVQEGEQVGTPNWYLFYSQIEGFTYEPGFVYTLEVQIRKIANPPADASDRKYKLLKILSKEEV